MASAFVDDTRDRTFERLYERYDREVYRYALAVLRNPSEAEDVTQTTFLNAYRAIQAGEQPQKPHNWLIAIAHNACRSRVRFAMRRPREVPLDDVVEQLAVPDAERTNVRELLRALGRLPFNQRAAITMRELEGRSYDEIATTLGVTVPAVEALIGRARKALRLQAAALRGLVVVQLPRSLRRLFENADATAGSAAGTGVAVKAAAVVVAGVVAGGVGYTAAGHDRAHQPLPRLELAVQPATPLPARRRVEHAAPVVQRQTRTAPARTTGSVANVHTPASVRPSVDEPAAASTPPVAAAAPAPQTHPAAVTRDRPAAAAPHVAAATPRQAVNDVVQTVVAALPVTVPAPQLPPVELPPAPVPPVPDLPSPPLP